MLKDTTIGFFDPAFISAKLSEIVREGQISVEAKVTVDTIHSNVLGYCQQESRNFLEKLINWENKAQITTCGTNIQKVAKLITETLIIEEKTKGESEFSDSAKELVINFLQLFMLFIKETEKHRELISQSEIESYIDVLQGDILPDWKYNFISNVIQKILEDASAPTGIKDFIKKYN